MAFCVEMLLKVIFVILSTTVFVAFSQGSQYEKIGKRFRTNRQLSENLDDLKCDEQINFFSEAFEDRELWALKRKNSKCLNFCRIQTNSKYFFKFSTLGEKFNPEF
jgi:hypothetical protein